MISVVAAAEGGAPHAAAVGAVAPGAAGAASAADAGAGGSTRKTAGAERSPLPLKRNHMNCYNVIKHVVISMEISESMVAMSTVLSLRNATVLQHFVHLPCRLLLSKSNFRRWDEKLDCRRGD